MPNVLIVEDDQAMAVALRDGFAYEGFDVALAQDGHEGLRMATNSSPDVIVLDVMLPRLSGLDVCKRIRRHGSRVPIIMLTARGQEVDKVNGLKTGADDYVTKPFSFIELMARIEAVMRRSSRFDEREGLAEFRFGDVSIDFVRNHAAKGTENLSMSPREFRLLRFLIQNRNEVVTRDQLLDAVWGYDNVPFTRTVDMHIAKLRKKIEDSPQNPTHIVTVHRVGYKFVG